MTVSQIVRAASFNLSLLKDALSDHRKVPVLLGTLIALQFGAVTVLTVMLPPTTSFVLSVITGLGCGALAGAIASPVIGQWLDLKYQSRPKPTLPGQ